MSQQTPLTISVNCVFKGRTAAEKSKVCLDLCIAISQSQERTSRTYCSFTEEQLPSYFAGQLFCFSVI